MKTELDVEAYTKRISVLEREITTICETYEDKLKAMNGLMDRDKDTQETFKR